MLDQALAIIAPHHCYGCDSPGSLICQCCKSYILEEAFSGCVVCGVTVTEDNLCDAHALPYYRLWCVAGREGVIEKAIDTYKFQRAKSGYRVFAELLDGRLPDLPDDTIIVPVTTAPKNVRLRGYDHINLIADHLARLRSLEVKRLLVRRSNATQHFAKNLAKRREQAAEFFSIKGEINKNRPYLLIDDIFTTGSTVRAAADCLVEAGAPEVWVAVIARQINQKPKPEPLKT